MLCSLCQHGVTSKRGVKLTGAVWFCPCGEHNCRHIDTCKCGAKKARPPERGDYLSLGGENHTTIDAAHEFDGFAWIVEDNRGEDFRVMRDPDNDNEVRRAWRLTP